MAVEEILRNIEACNCVDANGVRVDRWHPDVIAAVNYREFFYRDMPDERLYIPLRVKPFKFWHRTDSMYFQFAENERRKQHEAACVDASKRNLPPPAPLTYRSNKELESYSSLSELLFALHWRWSEDPQAESRGVLLLSQSGAGKTAACWKAFYDCLFAAGANAVNGTSSQPDLRQYLPCWLSLNYVPKSGTQKQAMLELLARTAGILKPTDQIYSRIERYLRTGPPLLLFADLNAAPADARQQFATLFAQFRKNSESTATGWSLPTVRLMLRKAPCAN
ncbi:MAG: hypothetical protein R3C11_01350 [Planctomycetaceae bacterium]